MELLKKYPIPYEIIPVSTGDTVGTMRKVRALSKDGTVYLSQGSTLYKSDDWLDTQTEVFSASSTIQFVELLENGNIVVGCFNGDINLYDGESSQVVATTGTMSQWGGLSSYKNFVLSTAYTEDETLGVYLSKDYGENFELILQPAGVRHPHAAAFDPYEGIIWTVWGDGYTNDMIAYSNDLGENWYKFGNMARCTNIIPLPNSVLFGTDEAYYAGLFRHKRPENGTVSQINKADLFWNHSILNQDNLYVWATHPSIDHKNGLGYFGFLQQTPQLPAGVFATDGNHVYQLWTQDKITDVIAGSGGIIGVWGPDNNGQLIADLRSTYDGFHSHLLKLDLS